MTIEVENVCLTVEGKEILKDISWEISSDDTWLLSGDAGSGKTALISVILGLLKPDSGRVRLLGDYKYDRVNAGVVFQEDRLIETLSAAENAALVRKVTSPAVRPCEHTRQQPYARGEEDRRHSQGVLRSLGYPHNGRALQRHG